MGSVRHETIIDVDLDTVKANAKAKQLQALIDQLSGAMRNIGGGNGGGGPTGGGGPGEGPAAPSPPPGMSPTYPGGSSAPPALVHAPNVTPGAPAPTPGAIQPVPYTTMPAPAPAPAAPNALPGGGSEQPRSLTTPDASTGSTSSQKKEKDSNKEANDAVRAITHVASAFAGGGPGMALGVVQAGAQGLSNVAQNVGISGAAVPILGATAGLAGIMLGALNYRYGVAVRRAQLDERSNALGLYGGGGMGGGGYTPEEAVGIMGAFGQGAGYSTALQDTDVLKLNRSGTSVGAMAAYAGTSAAGMGGIGKPNVESLITAAQSSNLRGAKSDEYLQRIAAAITQLGENGMSLNLAGTEQFMRRLASTGAFQGSGMAQARLFTSVEGAAVGARSRILANYANVGEEALMGAALRQPGGPHGAAEWLANLSTEDKMAVIARERGADAAQGWYMNNGQNQARARAATGALGAEKSMAINYYGAGTLKNAYATSERKLLRMVGAEDAGIFEQKSKADAVVMAIGKSGEAAVTMLSKVVDTLTSVDATAQGIADEVRKALEALKNL